MSLVGLAGCASEDSKYENLQGPVPDTYLTASSQGGTGRSPDNLRSKSSVSYHDAQGAATCENCIHYIPDKNDDGLGACSLVEGYIEPKAWCTIYAKHTE
ncbi:high-potential iron-sulfur protein [Haloarchaeobius iranensis]|nr:high-potential iron-sulfur protein [Haloarchaeobius iranensis]